MPRFRPRDAITTSSDENDISQYLDQSSSESVGREGHHEALFPGDESDGRQTALHQGSALVSGHSTRTGLRTANVFVRSLTPSTRQESEDEGSQHDVGGQRKGEQREGTGTKTRALNLPALPPHAVLQPDHQFARLDALFLGQFIPSDVERSLANQQVQQERTQKPCSALNALSLPGGAEGFRAGRHCAPQGANDRNITPCFRAGSSRARRRKLWRGGCRARTFAAAG